MLALVGAETQGTLDSLLSNPLLALLVVVTLGLLLGRMRVAGLSLGSSGVIFTALAMGHFGYEIPAGVGVLGLTVFAYCVGLTAGPRFFRVFWREGKPLAVICVVLIGIGAVTAFGASRLLGIPADLTVGIFAGALTSTPGLAATMESFPAGSQVAVGYGLAYPFGVICIVLFVQLVPRMLRVDLRALGEALQSQEQEDRRIVRVLVEVCNPAMFGKSLGDLAILRESNCQIARILSGDRLTPLPAGLVLTEGQRLLLIARAYRLPPIIDLLGRRDEMTGLILDIERESMHVVVSSPNVAGKNLDDLRLRANFGVTLTRIMRHDVEFVPKPNDVVEYGDMLNMVGEEKDLDAFAAFAGHRAKSFDETDLISLGVGLIAGVLLGMTDISLGGTSLALGMAGGPLLVALILSHVDHIGPIRGHIPAAARMLMMEAGLVLFLASAGVSAGGALEDVLGSHGLTLCVAAGLVVVVPVAAGSLLARFLFRMNLLQILGVVCGGMTSTPGLGAVTAKTDSDVPLVSYAAAYPVALIVITLVVKVLVELLT
ncbi:MAG: hypothetical protein GY778_24465 [bacterium]|nr:hypothetical protein [bacterium]